MMTQATPNQTAPNQNDLLQRQTELLQEINEQLKRQGRQSKRQADVAEDSQGWISLAIAWGAYFIILSIPVAQTGIATTQQVWNNIADSRLGRMANLPTWASSSIVEGVSVEAVLADKATLKVGDTVAGYQVTSPFGPRSSPGGIGSTDHKGVDVATPVGTPLYTPFAARVECGSGGAGGNEAIIYPADSIGIDYIAFSHLSACYAGTYKAGDKVALSGNTGNSTGPHLHFSMKIDGVHIDPWRGLVLASIDPSTIPKTGAFSVQSYKAAISNQESNNNYSLVNPDSGAMGKYQFMPSTMRSTASVCPGVSGIPSNQQFLASPELQEKIMDCYLNRALKTAQGKSNDPFIQCRMLASYHYSGSLDLWNNTAPQSYGGNSYPSIANYTESVCKNVK